MYVGAGREGRKGIPLAGRDIAKPKLYTRIKT